MVVVDTVRTGAPPGTLHRLEVRGPLPLPDRRGRHSSHALSLGDLIELARALDRLPGRLVIIGIEGGRLGEGVGLSAPVQAAVDAVATAVLEELAGQPAGPTAAGRWSGPRGQPRCDPGGAGTRQRA